MNEIYNILKGAGGPGWVIVLGTFFILGLRVVYIDFGKNYIIDRLNIELEKQRGRINSRQVVNILEGQYHVFGRQLITAAYQAAHGLDSHQLADADVHTFIRTTVSYAYQSAIRNLHDLRFEANDLRLDIHLRGLTEDQKREFYGPIIAEIVSSPRDASRVRNVVLEQIDAFIAQAVKDLHERPRAIHDDK